MTVLETKLKEIIPGLRKDIRSLVKEHGDKVISEVSVAQAYGGMRGVKGLVCDTSLVDPEKGLIIRGIPIIELTEKLPEEIFYLLLTGELPDKEETKKLEAELHERHEVPQYVWDVLRSMPEDAHPMTMLSTAVLVLERDSIFRRRYNEGMPKEEYWEPAFQDALNLLGKLPVIAGGIYQLRFGKGEILKAVSRHKNWAGCYAEALGVEDLEGEFADFLRLYLVLHSDHEGGNVSANTCHTVGSALSSPYLAVSAGLNGLAGPLHGLANQECLKFVLGMMEEFGGAPTKEQIKEYAWNTLNSGKVIPGYGHAVLRKTDPRFIAFHDFGKKVCPDAPTFKTVAQMYEVIPDILKEHGKAKNPYPNVDAGSGSLLYHYDIKEFDYYTVLFGVSRSLGMLSQLILNRALGTPITRPKSVQTSWIEEQVGAR